MLSRTDITTEQAEYAMEHGDFGEDVTRSAENVAIVLTQSWCPQWLIVREWMKDFNDSPDADALDVQVFVLIYDTADYFDRFRRFKEDVYGNHQVPYVRYYTDGRLVNESNYVSRRRFLKAFR
jgi:hypothetical protein